MQCAIPIVRGDSAPLGFNLPEVTCTDRYFGSMTCYSRDLLDRPDPRPLETAETGQLFELLEALDARLRWLSSWTIHHANFLRGNDDGIKVGGHQASCASMSTLMAVLYACALRPEDKVAVKPHAAPLLHALHYLLGQQSLDQLKRFRDFGGAQSYPSRTKDCIPVDFSTGSVGLGVAITAFASLVQDYLLAHGRFANGSPGRMIALMGDAELDEGNIYECLIEGYKHELRNCWWIVDYNRQSLDATTADRMFRRFDDIFETCGWRVVTLKHGKRQRELFQRPGGDALADWIDRCPNADFAALTYRGGAAWRERLTADLGDNRLALDLVHSFDDDGLAAVMTNLGGHCPETIAAAFAAADDERPTLFIAYTIKGHGLPLAGHKDNHAGLMTRAQIDALRQSMHIAEGEEWAPFAGLGDNVAGALRGLLERSALAVRRDPPHCEPVVAPTLRVTHDTQSTQVVFGKLLNDLARSGHPIADRIVTTSPDVTVSTNLGPWVNQRGLFRREAANDVFRLHQVPSPQKWGANPAGQHLELGIAENNLFLMLTALGLSAPLFGGRLIPIGTVYDPFIARGLDALNYGCYQDARFILVATPSGLTLGREGGAHQSINTPLIAMGQPGLTMFEPAFADELAAIFEWSLNHVQADEGGSVYLRLTTRSLQQPQRTDESWREGTLAGAYWLRAPGDGADGAIVAMGAMLPEAIAAWSELVDDIPGLGLLVATSPQRLHQGWTSARSARWRGAGADASHIDRLLAPLSDRACLVTLCDGAPAALSWLGSVRGHRVTPLGVESFGQTGSLEDLYRIHGLDRDAIFDGFAEHYILKANRDAG